VGDEVDLNITEVATECAIMCFGEDGLDACLLGCIDQATKAAVSSDCARCDTAAALCAIGNRLAHCVSDPTSAECIDCRCGSGGTTPNCVGDFETCAGIDSQVCTHGR